MRMESQVNFLYDFMIKCYSQAVLFRIDYTMEIKLERLDEKNIIHPLQII